MYDAAPYGRLTRRATLPSGRRIVLSVHAIVRYDERAAGGMGLELASQRLCELVGCIGCETPRPDWLWILDGGADFFVALGEDIVLPVRSRTAVTLVARGGMSDAARARRNHRKQLRRQDRRYGATRRDGRNPYPYQRMRSYHWTSAVDGPWPEPFTPVDGMTSTG